MSCIAKSFFAVVGGVAANDATDAMRLAASSMDLNALFANMPEEVVEEMVSTDETRANDAPSAEELLKTVQNTDMNSAFASAFQNHTQFTDEQNAGELLIPDHVKDNDIQHCQHGKAPLVEFNAHTLVDDCIGGLIIEKIWCTFNNGCIDVMTSGTETSQRLSCSDNEILVEEFEGVSCNGDSRGTASYTVAHFENLAQGKCNARGGRTDGSDKIRMVSDQFSFAGLKCLEHINFHESIVTSNLTHATPTDYPIETAKKADADDKTSSASFFTAALATTTAALALIV